MGTERSINNQLVVSDSLLLAVGRRRWLVAAGWLRLAVALLGLRLLAVRGGSLGVAVLIGLPLVVALDRRLDGVGGRDHVVRRLDLAAIDLSVILFFVPGRQERRHPGAAAGGRAGGSAEGGKQVS